MDVGAAGSGRWRALGLGLRPDHAFVLLGLAIVVVLAWRRCGGDAGPRPCWPRAQILAALRFVESGDRNPVPDGDAGLAIGPYQIHEVYWRDAVAFRPHLGGDYQRCRERTYAEAVIAAYMERWVPDAWQAGDAEIIARTHNGGPTGPSRPQTLAYWERVRARLSR